MPKARTYQLKCPKCEHVYIIEINDLLVARGLVIFFEEYVRARVGPILTEIIAKLIEEGKISKCLNGSNIS